MPKEFLTGNEAFAHAALEAGVRVCAGYPGTPSSELIETIARCHTAGTAHGVHVEWSTNEKAALELLAGAAYAGARALFTCKQVGLNVASDALMSLNYVGVKGGLVLYVTDDPGPISSQTEQDTRRFAAFAKVPVLDPATPEQGCEMMRRAFELSERYATPVILRATTRVCHASTFIDVEPETWALEPEGFERDPRWVIFPRRAYQAHDEINTRLRAIAGEFAGADYAEFNPIEEVSGGAEPNPELGILAGGVSYAYAVEALRQVRGEAARGALVRVTDSEAPRSSADGSSAVEESVVGDACASGSTGKVSVNAVPSDGTTCGVAYANDGSVAIPPVRIMQVGTPYPFPSDRVEEFTRDLSRIIVFEELDHVLEDELVRLAGRIHAPYDVVGKTTGHTLERGENSIDALANELRAFFGLRLAAPARAFSLPVSVEAKGSEAFDAEQQPCDSDAVLANAGVAATAEGGSFGDNAVEMLADFVEPPARPPLLCPGCPHRGSFYACKVALGCRRAGIMCGDIGCYTLGNAQPLDAVDTCLCMGAGITVAQGMSVVEPDKKALAFIGDSTFFASGMTGVANAVYNQHDVTIVVLDNATTAMTGSQPHPGTGVTLMGSKSRPIAIEGVLRALGVQVITRANPLYLDDAVVAAKKAIDHKGPSAVIFESPCVKLVPPTAPVQLDANACTGCRRCLVTMGCPALSWDSVAAHPHVDESLCTGCGLCVDVCRDGALSCSERPARRGVGSVEYWAPDQAQEGMR